MLFRFCLSMLLVEIKGNLLRFIWLNMHLRFSTIWIFNFLKIFCTLFFNFTNFFHWFLYSSLSGFLRLLGIYRYLLCNLIRVSCGLLWRVGIRHLRFNNFFSSHFVLNFVLFSLWHFSFFLVMALFFFWWLFLWLHWGVQIVWEWIKFFFRFFFRIFFMFFFWSFWFFLFFLFFFGWFFLTVFFFGWLFLTVFFFSCWLFNFFFFVSSWFLFFGFIIFIFIIIFLFFIMTSNISISCFARIIIMTRCMRLWKFFKIFTIYNGPLEFWVVFEFCFNDSVMSSTKLNRMLCNFIIPRLNFLIISEDLIFNTSRLE